MFFGMLSAAAVGGRQSRLAPPTVAAGSGPRPNSPSGLNAEGAAGSFTVTWVAPLFNSDGSSVASPGITSYTAYYGTTVGEQQIGGSYVASASVAAGTLTKTFTSVTAGVKWVAVSATNSNGEGYSSPEIQVTVT